MCRGGHRGGQQEQQEEKEEEEEEHPWHAVTELVKRGACVCELVTGSSRVISPILSPPILKRDQDGRHAVRWGGGDVTTTTD